jgi:hypothetical protein
LQSPLQHADADAGTPALTILARTCAERLVRSTPSSEYASLPLFGFVGVGGPLAAIEVDGGLFVPLTGISPRFISTPISSYSGTSTSGRDSENSYSAVAFGVGI